MKLLTNIILALIALGLVYMLYVSIEEPISFDKAKEGRKEVVSKKLIEIRKAQEMYRDITGVFADSFEKLSDTLKYGKFVKVAVIGDPDDQNFTGVITYDTTIVNAADSIKALGMNVDSLRYIPFTDGKSFEIKAAEIENQGIKTPVVEVGTKWKTFMGQYGDIRFAKYDQRYNPDNYLKFGDMNKPSLAGNWE